MIKKSVFEEELIAGMHNELVKQATAQDCDNVEAAVDYLNSAIDIFEDAGMSVQASQVLNIISKIAFDENDAKRKPKDPRKISDPHIKGLTPEKQIANLKHHGTVFNMNNDGQAVDDNDISDVKSVPQPESFKEDYEKWLWMKDAPKRKKVTREDIDPDLAGLFSDEDIANWGKADDHLSDLAELDNAEANDLLNIDISDNALEVSEKDLEPETEDFEDERD